MDLKVAIKFDFQRYRGLQMWSSRIQQLE